MVTSFLHRSRCSIFRVGRLCAFTSSHCCFQRPSDQSTRALRTLRSSPKRPRTAFISCVQATLNTSALSSDGWRSVESPVAQNDTIFALSSGAGVTSGVAIIRLSGSAAVFCLSKLLEVAESGGSSRGVRIPRPRYAGVRKLYHPFTQEVLDEAIVIYFPGPKSFTGEDVVELHVHGSRAVINGVIEALESLDGCDDKPSGVRPAERGEFSRRAFENGRMDLTRVEGLADLISAETAMQRKQALRQLGGEVRDLLEGWREEIKTCLAHAEAVIDFGDDIDDDAFEAIVPRMADLCEKMKVHVNDRHRGEIVRGGARVAIVGEPNAGKSTLLNALVKRPAAIVSPQAGTTRDVVEVQLDLNGLAVVVSDTAGLRDKTVDPIEMEGMKRARDAASSADITILVHDASCGGLEEAVKSFPALIKATGGATEGTGDFTGEVADVICVANKVDLLESRDVRECIGGVRVFKTCLLRNDGITELTTYMEQVLRSRLEGDDGKANQRNGNTSSSDNIPIITRARHRHHMTAAVSALTRFVEGRSGDDRELLLPMDLATEDLRIAAKELGAITGVIHSEEVLDVIFSEFCIGK